MVFFLRKARFARRLGGMFCLCAIDLTKFGPCFRVHFLVHKNIDTILQKNFYSFNIYIM